MGTLPLNFQLGTQWQYTGTIGFAVLGRGVEIVSGMNLDQFFKQRIFTPLDMNNRFFDIPSNRLADVATLYRRDGEALIKQAPVRPLPAGVEFYNAAGGLRGDAEDYLRFCEMLLNGGQSNGKRILSRKFIELMIDNAIGDLDLRNHAVPSQNLTASGFYIHLRLHFCRRAQRSDLSLPTFRCSIRKCAISLARTSQFMTTLSAA